MPIPHLNRHGFLPPGVHGCSLDEIKLRFGSFHGSDRRTTLFNALLELVADLRRSDLFVAIVLDGSFVTDVTAPNDIDLVLVLRQGHDWDREPTAHEYNILSRQRLRRRFAFDAFLAVDGETDYDEVIEFFARVRDNPDIGKGMLRIEL